MWEQIKARLVQKQIRADLMPAEPREHNSPANSAGEASNRGEGVAGPRAEANANNQGPAGLPPTRPAPWRQRTPPTTPTGARVLGPPQRMPSPERVPLPSGASHCRHALVEGLPETVWYHNPSERRRCRSSTQPMR